MAKYFVRKHCKGLERLCIRIFDSQDYYYGKNNLGGFICKDREPKSFEWKLYGLDSKQEASELIAKMQVAVDAENATGLWQTTLEIVEEPCHA